VPLFRSLRGYAIGTKPRITCKGFGGSLSFTVRGNSAGIYVLDGPGKIGEDEQYLR